MQRLMAEAISMDEGRSGRTVKLLPVTAVAAAGASDEMRTIECLAPTDSRTACTGAV
jgi:hypothetical protein